MTNGNASEVSIPRATSEYDDMTPQERFIALFTAADEARKIGGHEAAKAVWNGWAEPLAREREALEAAGLWSTKAVFDNELGRKLAGLRETGLKLWDGSPEIERDYAKELGMVVDVRPNDRTQHYLRRANLSAAFLFLVERDRQEHDSGLEGTEQFSGAAVQPVKLVLCQTISFAGFLFPGNASFSGVRFKGNASFYQARFKGDAFFRLACFQNEADFIQARFKGDAAFYQARFKGPVSFYQGRFHGETSFRNACFKGNAYFRQAHFEGNNVFFTEARFKDNASFRQADFLSHTVFLGARFFKQTNFTAIEVKRAFDLARARFHGQPPRFIQAHFAESPRLDHIDLPLPTLGDGRLPALRTCPDDDGWRFDPATTAVLFQIREEELAPDAEIGEPDEASGEDWPIIERDGKRYRQPRRLYRPQTRSDPDICDKQRSALQDNVAAYVALRRMAIQAQDHETEHNAFKGELRARRALAAFDGELHALLDRSSLTGRLSAYGVAVGLYDRLTDVGWSYLRPALAWLLAVTAMTAIYLAAVPNGLAPPPGCREGERMVHALTLSLHNGLLFAASGQRAFINRAYVCLYGRNGEAAATATAADGRQAKPVRLPAHLGLLGTLHTLLSAILIFFILLALRNRFRIR